MFCTYGNLDFTARKPWSELSSHLQKAKKEMMEKENQSVQNQIVHRFLSKMRDQKVVEMETLKRQLDTVESDLAIAERRIRDQNDTR